MRRPPEAPLQAAPEAGTRRPPTATPPPAGLHLDTKHGSFEADDSLGILTPDQMDDLLALDEDLGLVEPVPPPPQHKAACFVTSVTSITSLDNGYQGDGEWSRPASRGADHSPAAPALRRDPMTDSDFFTESDGDELAKGDRRARVIDGTLYPTNPPLCLRPGFSPCEEMESSGVFSDLDQRRPDDPQHDPPQSQSPHQVRANSPEGSIKTVPSPCEQSVKKLSPGAYSELIMEQVKTIKSLMMQVDQGHRQEEKKHKVTKARTVVTKIKTIMQPRKEAETTAAAKIGRWDAVMSRISQGTSTEEKARLREVKSRVYSGLGSAQPATRLTQQQSPSTRSLRDSPSSRSLRDSPSSRSLRDSPSSKFIKGRRVRVRGSECSMPSQTAASSRNSSISDVSQVKSPPPTTRSVKKRDSVRSGSPQGEVCSAKKPTLPASGKLKPTSSFTGKAGEGVKSGCVGGGKAAAGGGRGGGGRGGGGSSKRPVCPRPPGGLTPAGPPLLHAPPDVGVSGEEVGEADLVGRLLDERPDESSSLPPPPAPLPAPLDRAQLTVDALTVLVNHLVVNLDAFSTPRLKEDLDRVKQDWLNTTHQLEKAECCQRRLEEETTALALRAQQADHLLQLQIDNIKQVSANYEQKLQEVEAKHQQEVSDLKSEWKKREVELEAARVEAASREAEHCRAEEQLRRQVEDLKTARTCFLNSLTAADKDTTLKAAVERNSELESEVDSLRCVLELRCTELQELRRQSQAWQLEADQLPQLKQTVHTYRAKLDHLTDRLALKEANEQKLVKENDLLNQSLNQGFTQNKRLSMQNEELQWKLKQNSKVVYALANLSADQNVFHSAEVRKVRLSHKAATTPFKATDESSPEHRWWTDGDNGALDGDPGSPKVKAVVEKGDSVSWTVEMEEPAEAVASRLLRRATSLRDTPRHSPHNIRTLRDKDEVIVLKGDDMAFFDIVDGGDITIDEVRLRPKSDEELEMLRRVEEGGRGLVKDTAGEAMVSGGASDDEDMVLDSPGSPQPAHLAVWH